MLKIILLLLFVYLSLQQVIGPSNTVLTNGDNFFVGADGFTICRACEIDCMSLGVFSSCQYKYYRYGCYKTAYCLSNETAMYLDRFAAVAYCSIWSKCTFKTPSINWVANQLSNVQKRTDIWTQADFNPTLNYLKNALQQLSTQGYQKAYATALLRVRAELVRNHMLQQQVRHYMRFKIVQDVKTIQAMYGNNAAVFKQEYDAYWKKYLEMPFWFAQQAMFPTPFSDEELKVVLNAQSGEEYLFDNLNYFSDKIVNAYLAPSSSYCIKRDSTSSTCETTVYSSEQAAREYFSRFPTVVGNFMTRSEVSEFQIRSSDYRFIRTYMPSMSLGPTYHGITAEIATVSAPSGWKLLNLNVANDNKGIKAVYPISPTEWVIQLEKFTDESYVRPVTLYDPFDLYELKVFTQTGTFGMGQANTVGIPSGYSIVSGGFKLLQATTCPPSNNIYATVSDISSKVLLHTSFPIQNGWGVTVTTQDMSINCIKATFTTYAIGIKRKSAPSQEIAYFFPPILSRIEDYQFIANRAGCAITNQGTTADYPLISTVSTGAQGILTQQGNSNDLRAIQTCFIMNRDSYSSGFYPSVLMLTSSKDKEMSFSSSKYKNNVQGVTLFVPPPNSNQGANTGIKCEMDYMKAIKDYKDAAVKANVEYLNEDLYGGLTFGKFWESYQKFKPSRSQFKVSVKLCDKQRCVTKTCSQVEACYYY